MLASSSRVFRRIVAQQHQSPVLAGAAQPSQQQQQTRWRHDATMQFKLSVQPESFNEQALASFITGSLGGKEVSRQKITDVYYDGTAGPDGAQPDNLHTLTRRDIWLRKRNGSSWECKAPFIEDVTRRTHLNVPVEKRIPNYRELFGERDIRIELNIQQDALRKESLRSLDDSLKERSIVPFATVGSEVVRYQLSDECVLELVKTDFGYTMCIVSSFIPQAKEREVKQRGDQITALIQQIESAVPGVSTQQAAKAAATATAAPLQTIAMPIIEFIYRKNKDHFRALVKAGIVADKSE